MQETLPKPKYNERRMRRVGFGCLNAAIEQRRHQPLNNDPLAHVWKLFEDSTDPKLVENQIRTEFVTDIGERSREHHFYGSFDFSVNGDDLVSEDGVSLKQILNEGLRAAKRDGIQHGIERAERLADHLRIIMAWMNQESGSQLYIASLCPEPQELSTEIARRLCFKTDRLMSSNWVFEKTVAGVRMHAFSLDSHSLASHEKMLGRLGVPLGAARDTSMEELSEGRNLYFADGYAAVEAIRSQHDELLASGDPGHEYYYGIKQKVGADNANEYVERHPKAYEYYRDAVSVVAEAITVGRATRRFVKLTKELRDGYKGFDAPIGVLNTRHFQKIRLEDCDQLMDYLRSVAIPHFIFARGDSTGDSIATSGAEATASGIKYEGACPSSSLTTVDQARSDQARLEVLYFGRLPRRERSFPSRYCPCCLPKPQSGVTVNAWMGEGFIGCDDCGHIVDICGGVVKEGTPPKRETKKAPLLSISEKSEHKSAHRKTIKKPKSRRPDSWALFSKAA